MRELIPASWADAVVAKVVLAHLVIAASCSLSLNKVGGDQRVVVAVRYLPSILLPFDR